MLQGTLALSSAGRGGARQLSFQSTLDSFMRSRLEELRGSAPSLAADDGSACGARRRLIVDVYDVLRSSDSSCPGGLSSQAIAVKIIESDARGLAASSRGSVAVEQLEPWVDAALRALEETGFTYRAGIRDERFLASISDRRLDEKDLDDLLRAAFSSSNLWIIAAQGEVHSESLRQGRASRHQDGAEEDIREDNINGATVSDLGSIHRAGAVVEKRRRTAIGALTQLYTTTHEIRTKHEAAAAPRACPWNWKGGRSLHEYVGVGRECTGRLSAGAAHRMWSAALLRTSKAVICSSTLGAAPRAQLGAGPSPTCIEYSSTGEYVLCARTDGNLTVFRSSSIQHRMRRTWPEAAALAALSPVRDVRGGRRSVDCAHWNPASRNEVATSSRSSGDVHVFDMKVCGVTTNTRGAEQQSRNTPTTIFSQRQTQANGSVLDFAYAPGSQSLVIAGTSKGVVVVWDARNPKANKGVMKQEHGGVCYLQMLRDGFSVVAGTTQGVVHVWDLRSARASMAVMVVAGATSDRPTLSAHLQPQLPLLNANSDVVPGSVGATWDEMHPRAYALEPSQQVDVAFSFGQRTVGVLNLLSRRVTHAYNTNRPDPHADDAHDPQRRRLAWLQSPCGHSTLAMRNSDEASAPSISLFRLRAPQGPTHSFGVFHTQGAGGSRSGGEDAPLLGAPTQCIMKEQRVKVPRAVSALCSSPADSTLTLGFIEGTVASVGFGHGAADSTIGEENET